MMSATSKTNKVKADKVKQDDDVRSISGYYRVYWNSARLCCAGSIALIMCQARKLRVPVEPGVTKPVTSFSLGILATL